MLDHVSWLQEDAVIYVKYKGIITLDSFQEGAEKAVALMQSTHSKPIHVIIDTTYKIGVDEGLHRITKLADATRVYRRHQRLGWTIGVDTNPNVILRFATELVLHAAHLKVHFSEGVPQALAFLNQMNRYINVSSHPPPDDTQLPTA